MAELISVIVTTYNREDALEAVLRSLARQTDQDFEVIVADDGSAAATAAADRGLEGEGRPPPRSRLARRPWLPRRRNPQPRDPRRARQLLHLPRRRLHRAAGFCRHPSPPGRAGLVRHRQPHPAVADADRQSAAREAHAGNLESCALARRALARRRQPPVGAAAPAARAAAPAAAATPGAARAPAISRSGASDLDRVDGFDADYSGWGKEDSDIIVRLLHAGVRRKDGVFATGVLHLWHPRSRPSDGWRRIERKLVEISSPATASARSAGCPRCRLRRRLLWQGERWPTLSIASRLDRARLAKIADGLAVAVAVSLPWSTSATSILLVLWLIALIPTLDWADLRRELLTRGRRLAGLAVSARRRSA